MRLLNLDTGFSQQRRDLSHGILGAPGILNEFLKFFFCWQGRNALIKSTGLVKESGIEALPDLIEAFCEGLGASTDSGKFFFRRFKLIEHLASLKRLLLRTHAADFITTSAPSDLELAQMKQCVYSGGPR